MEGNNSTLPGRDELNSQIPLIGVLLICYLNHSFDLPINSLDEGQRVSGPGVPKL